MIKNVAINESFMISFSDLSFKKGDIILLKKQVDENWYQGELNNRQGFFPAPYVQVTINKTTMLRVIFCTCTIVVPSLY
jgi:hypothetical protein